MILEEKESKLIAIAHVLDTRLPRGGFEALLAQYQATDAPRKEKIKILNRVLKDSTDAVGTSSAGLGVGYYSRDLDAIITYGPSTSFARNVGVTIPDNHPGRAVMKTNQPLVESGSMVRGDILNAMIPIERGGHVIGYIWANELTTDITAQIDAMTRHIFMVMIFCCALVFCLLLLLSRRTLRDVDRIIEGVRAMRYDISKRIESAGGDLDEVVNSINDMAADVDKATKETNRAISVLQSVMANVDAMIYVCDPETKKLVYTNDYLARLLKRHDLEGKHCYEVLYDDTAPCSFCPQEDLFDESGSPLMEPVSKEVHNKLINRDFLVTSRLVTWHDGRLLHIEVGTDVTERNALAVAEAANQAQQDFLARMSHDVRAPINNVLAMAQLALDSGPAPVQTGYLKKIQSSSILLLGIISDILDFSRIEAGILTIEKQIFNVRDMIENVRERIQLRMNDTYLNLRLTVDSTVPEYAIGDSLRLSQVLLNLLDNAVKFTIKGPISLDISTEVTSTETLRINCTVQDTGMGMSKEQQQVLSAFFSHKDLIARPQFAENGLGLFISKALVELMGGKMRVSSKAGSGSEFSFFVEFEPFYGSSKVIEEQGKLWKNARYDDCKILLVENNIVNQEIAKTLLSGLGVQVDIADNGIDAIKAFLKSDYAMILVDVLMPVMDGLEITRRIRTSQKHDATTVPIVAMTENAMLEDRLASKEVGMNSHITKPIDVNELKNVLYHQLQKKN